MGKPVVNVSASVKIDLGEVNRHLSPAQLQALMSGIGAVLTAGQLPRIEDKRECESWDQLSHGDP